jgi:hypothetical protein
MLAALVIETVATQEYRLDRAELVSRFEDGFGAGAARDIAHLVGGRLLA